MWAALLDGLVVQVALEDPVVDVALAKRIALGVAVKELGLVLTGGAEPRRTSRHEGAQRGR